jgi:hypothetical protein
VCDVEAGVAARATLERVLAAMRFVSSFDTGVRGAPIFGDHYGGHQKASGEFG